MSDKRRQNSYRRYTSGMNCFDFLIFLMIFLYQFISKGSYPDYLSNISVIFVTFLLGIRFIYNLKTQTFRQLLISSNFIFGLLFSIIFAFGYAYCQGRFDLVMSLLISVAFWNIGLDLYFRYIGYVVSALFLSHLLLYMFGIIQEHVADMERLTDEGVIYRKALGFDHPNYTACFILAILSAGIVVKKIYEKFFFLSCAFVVNLLCFRLTDSRTAFISVIAGFVIFVIFSKILNRRDGYIYVIFTLLISFFLSIFIPYLFYDNTNVNFIFSQRPRLFYNLLQNPVPVFSNNEMKIRYLSGESIDNFLLNILYGYGIIILLVIVIVLVHLSKTDLQRKSNEISTIIIIYLIYGLTENHVLDYGFTVIGPLLFLSLLNPNFFDKDIMIYSLSKMRGRSQMKNNNAQC